MEKNFIIGFGAQKGGTTWLAENLKQAGVRFPWGKEARILSHSLNKDERRNMANSKLEKALDLTEKSLSNVNDQNKKNILKAIANPKQSQALLPIIKRSEKNYRLN